MKGKGLYGQLQGNEVRQSGAIASDHFSANDLVEGDHVAILRRMAEEREWNQITSYCQDLKNAGHAQYRIDSMIARSTVGLKF
jgi:ectoine hydroxylase-related dioxygenase (phytanoyl-CoA dioxygenase family)